MTQKETVLQYLQNNTWVCGTEFQKVYIPEFRSLINVLKKEGHPVKGVICTMHKHNGGMKMWRLEVAQVTEVVKDFLKQWPSRVSDKLF